jgi:hypothetical protein
MPELCNCGFRACDECIAVAQRAGDGWYISKYFDGLTTLADLHYEYSNKKCPRFHVEKKLDGE